MKTFNVFANTTIVMYQHYRIEAETQEEAEQKVREGEGTWISEQLGDCIGDTEIIEEETEEVTAAELRELEVDDARHKAIIELAREEYQRDGETEIDNDATLSEGAANGCYVQAWVWVSFEDTPYNKETKEPTE